ncbi:MAG TPA: hypothetical protein G4O16_06250 [Dehalococcoidia bacterium]|nr:hypothetical protein [Dehalococcoidia bacterium]
MNNKHFRTWTIATLTLAVICTLMRSFWQIAVIPTAGQMVIFIPIIVGLIFGTVIFIYIALKPQRIRSLFFLTLISLAVTGGLAAGLIHYVNFMTSPGADPVLSKIISTCFLIAGISAYFLAICFLWSLRKTKESHG